MKFLVAFSLLIFFVDNPAGHTSEKTKFFSCEKTYIGPNQIYIGEEGLFINVNNNWVQTESIHTDVQGCYFNNVRADEFTLTWQCPFCGRINGILDSYCKNKDCPSRK